MSLPVAALLIGGAAVAYVLGQSKRASSTGGAQSPSQPPPTGGTAGAVDSTLPTSGLPIGLGQRDVSGDIRNDEPHFLPCTQTLQANGIGGASWQGVKGANHGGTILDNWQNAIGVNNAFFRFFYLPATRVLPSEITQYEWRLAFSMLGGGMHRRMDLEAKYQNFLLGIKQDQESSLAGSIVGQIASIIPIIGKVFNSVVQSQVASANAADISEARAAGAQASSYRFVVDPHNLDPPAAMVLQPSWNGEGEKIFDVGAAPWIGENGLILTRPPIGGGINGANGGSVPKVYQNPTDWPWTDVLNGTNYNAHARFFTCFQYGMFMPWVCDEIFAKPTMTTKASVNLCARIYKAMDLLSVMAFPDSGVRNHSARGTVGRTIPQGSWMAPYFYYHNAVLGDVLGSVFPPTAEDQPIVDDAGYQLNYYGGLMAPYAFVGRDGIRRTLPSPKNAAEKAQYDAQYQQWVVANNAVIAADNVRGNLPANAQYYVDVYNKRKPGGLDTPDVDGTTWHSMQFAFAEIALFPQNMVADLSADQIRYAQAHGPVDTSKMQTDSAREWNLRVFQLSHHSM